MIIIYVTSTLTGSSAGDGRNSVNIPDNFPHQNTGNNFFPRTILVTAILP